MDSGNSGSMHSSSGGDEENDFPFLINPSLQQFTSISIPQPHPLSQPHPPTFFDPPSHNNNLGSFSHTQPNPNPNPLHNLDLMWSRNLRSEPNYTEFGNPNQSLNLGSDQAPTHNQFPSSVGGNEAPPKNPKKRTRASRRAPTTVLTTDTTNFRQMVQEFTGIPTAPFSPSPYSRRLDFLATGTSGNRSGHLDALGPLYPLRPAAHKPVQPSPYPSSSSSPFFFNSNIATSNIQSENILNYQNPVHNFQSLLHLKNPLGNEPVCGTRAQGSSRVISLGELGMNQENFGARFSGFPSQGSVEVREGNNNINNSVNVSSYKLQPTASDLHPDKGLENVSSRGEGTMDSWIRPPDYK